MSTLNYSDDNFAVSSLLLSITLNFKLTVNQTKKKKKKLLHNK